VLSAWVLDWMLPQPHKPSFCCRSVSQVIYPIVPSFHKMCGAFSGESPNLIRCVKRLIISNMQWYAFFQILLFLNNSFRFIWGHEIWNRISSSFVCVRHLNMIHIEVEKLKSGSHSALLFYIHSAWLAIIYSSTALHSSVEDQWCLERYFDLHHS
jgi:hypothetical protein